MLFAANRAWLDGNNANHVHIIREIEYGRLKQFPLDGVLPLRGVRPDWKHYIHTLRTPRARAKRLSGGRYRHLFEHLGRGTKTIN